MKLKFFALMLSFLTLVFAGAIDEARAEEVTSQEKLSIRALKQRKYEEVKEVTDAELRAKAGSRSKWSLSAYLGYSGPRVTDLHEEVVPNPDNLPQEKRTSVTGSLGMRYRWSPSTSMAFDTGLRFYTPMGGARDGELNDPSLNLEKLYPLWGLQMRSRYSASVTTSEYYSSQGQVGTLRMAHDFKRKWSETSPFLWSVGSTFNWFLFDRAFQRGDSRGVSNYYFSVFPGIQYNIKDNFNVGTSLAFAYSNLRTEANWWNWDRRLWSQRLSFGYGVTRNVYLAPYLNFYPERFTWDTTGLNMNLYLNLF